MKNTFAWISTLNRLFAGANSQMCYVEGVQDLYISIREHEVSIKCILPHGLKHYDKMITADCLHVLSVKGVAPNLYAEENVVLKIIRPVIRSAIIQDLILFHEDNMSYLDLTFSYSDLLFVDGNEVSKIA